MSVRTDRESRGCGAGLWGEESRIPVLAAALAKRGLRKEDRYFFGDRVVSVTDVGEKSDNVLLGDDGVIYFVDPLIRLHRSAVETIEFLTGYRFEATPGH